MFLHEVSPDLDIHDLTVCTQERSAFNKEEKFSVLDVLVKDSQGRRYDIVMQVAPQRDLDKRARYYMFKLIENVFFVREKNTAREDKSVEFDDNSELIYLTAKAIKMK